MTPLVSILIPAYNAAPWIDATLRSAVAQTWPNTEIIVVDDGSPDNTLAVANAFASSHPDANLRVITQPNRGAAAARNHALRLARGDYIQFLDADDLLAPEKIASQLACMDSLGPSVLASGAWTRFTTDPYSELITPHANSRDLTGVEFLQVNFEAMTMMHPAAWLSPRQLLDRAGLWNESLSLNDDGEYFARVVLASERIVYCEAARSYYRSQISSSLSRRRDTRALNSLYQSVNLTIQHLLAADDSPRSRAAAAFGWKWTAFELYPGAPELASKAETACKKLGGSSRPFPGSGRFQLARCFLGWRLARRIFS